MGAAKGIDWDAQPLGKETDQEVADRLGVTAGSVAYARQCRGIAPLNESKVVGIDWDKQPLLGKISDNALARMLGVKPTTVAQARKARNIQNATKTRYAGTRSFSRWERENP